MTRKSLQDMVLVEIVPQGQHCGLMKLRPANAGWAPKALPGQFVQIQAPDIGHTLLRRPISVCDIDSKTRILSLLVRDAGAGTHSLLAMKEGEMANVLMPLGNGWDLSQLSSHARVLLVGGGVGVAPLVFLAKELQRRGCEPEILIGAKTGEDLMLIDEFRSVGQLHLATDDGTQGHHGLVTTHPVMKQHGIEMIYCCGPQPMMKAVARVARESATPCQVSLENMMACGLGACLCCVEDTVDSGNVCVCTEGPVFYTERLKWDI